jgi:hypothetical protein
MRTGRAKKKRHPENLDCDLNFIRTDGGHGGENMDFRRAADTIGNLR